MFDKYVVYGDVDEEEVKLERRVKSQEWENNNIINFEKSCTNCNRGNTKAIEMEERRKKKSERSLC